MKNSFYGAKRLKVLNLSRRPDNNFTDIDIVRLRNSERNNSTDVFKLNIVNKKYRIRSKPAVSQDQRNL